MVTDRRPAVEFESDGERTRSSWGHLASGDLWSTAGACQLVISSVHHLASLGTLSFMCL